MIPCLRDDFGRIYLVQTPSPPPEEEQNLYFVNTGRFVLRKYKTAKFYHSLDFILPKRLQDIIRRSITPEFPRSYLITQKMLGTRIYDAKNGGKLSIVIRSNLKTTINEFRHSLETYVEHNRLKFTCDELIMIRRIMGHGAETGDLYSRRASEPSIDWTTADVSQTTSLLESIHLKLGGDQ
jgi:hypothetical protein